MEKRIRFIINIVYFALLLLLIFFGCKYALPLLAPFLLAFVIAYLLRRPVAFLEKHLHLPHKAAAILGVLVFYSTIGLLLALAIIKLFSAAQTVIFQLPSLYNTYIAPVLMSISDIAEQSVLQMDPALVESIDRIWIQFVQSIGEIISSVSVSLVGGLSSLLATSLPGLFIKLLLMIISTFFIAVDYRKLTHFILRQLSPAGKHILFEIKQYIVGTLFVCIRSYALIMSITFVELAIGLSIIGVDRAVLIALGIAVFDILPVLGTGGIILPWAPIRALARDYRMAISLFVVYLIITVIRNIIEPKIVGQQIGLHPVVTLISMFVGLQLFGAVGLFGLPITLSLLRNLNDNGTIHLYRTTDDPEPQEAKTTNQP